MGHRNGREYRRYQRAVRRAFARVTYYRAQCAVVGRELSEPEPTPVAAVPQPPHTLCQFARPWLPWQEPSLWTRSLLPLARVLRMAGCDKRLPVIEISESLLDKSRLPGLRHRAYRTLLSPTAVVVSPAQRGALRDEAFDGLRAGLVVGSPEELAASLPTADGAFRPVHRLSLASLAEEEHTAIDHTADRPTLLFEPMLGYLGARLPTCGLFHLDSDRAYAHERDGQVTLSLLRTQRPTLLDIVPPGAHNVSVGRCAKHGTSILSPRS